MAAEGRHRLSNRRLEQTLIANAGITPYKATWLACTASTTRISRKTMHIASLPKTAQVVAKRVIEFLQRRVKFGLIDVTTGW